MYFIQISNNLDARVEAKSLRPNDIFILSFVFPFFLMILARFLLLPFNFCSDNSLQQFFQSGCGGDTFLSFPLSQNALLSPAFLSEVSLDSQWLIAITHLVSTFLFVWVFLACIFFYYVDQREKNILGPFVCALWCLWFAHQSGICEAKRNSRALTAVSFGVRGHSSVNFLITCLDVMLFCV